MSRFNEPGFNKPRFNEPGFSKPGTVFLPPKEIGKKWGGTVVVVVSGSWLPLRGGTQKGEMSSNFCCSFSEEEGGIKR